MSKDPKFPPFLEEENEKLKKTGLDKIKLPDNLVESTVDYCEPELEKLSESLEEKVTFREKGMIGIFVGAVASVYLVNETIQQIKHAYYHLRSIEHYRADGGSGDWSMSTYERELTEEEKEERKWNFSFQIGSKQDDLIRYSAKSTLLEILENCPGKQMDLAELSEELNKRETELLDLGVETLHVVYALMREDNKVEYDRKKKIIFKV